MHTNVLQYLDQIVLEKPDKIAYSDGQSSLTFAQVYSQSRSIGSFIAGLGIYKKPVVVFMQRCPETIVAFYGVICSGNFYVPLDDEMPDERIELIINKLAPAAIICDEKTRNRAAVITNDIPIFAFSSMVSGPIDRPLLSRIREKAIDTDPIYIVFTSGSTGIPKGVVACHRSVIDYIEQLSEILKVNENTIFGNQTPLYFDACLKELIPTLKYGATAYIIPRQHFLFPIQLIEFINHHKINTICWVVSALTMISRLNVLSKAIPATLKTIAFASEVFPVRQFNLWRQALPQTRFINFYGPTEATGVCCWYEADRDFGDDEIIPIGRPFPNREIILLSENDQPVNQHETGEICVRGTALTHGYYDDPERTREAFVQNPLNSHYPELIYRTGDLGRINERGELVFVSRKDNQIKHLGHRIELGEIESAANSIEGVGHSCCIYDAKKSRLILYYTGSVPDPGMADFLKQKLPRYMLPSRINQLSELPLTANSKIDRIKLVRSYERGEI
jgi:amino acid adenylation domain-containing protein